VRTYVVQTDSMSREVCKWQPGAKVKILSFRPHFPIEEHPSKEILWDYIYVSDGTGHKNHLNLLKAWEILSKEGIRPSLALTLGDENFSLVSQIANTSKKLNLRIKNLGLIPHENIIMSYKDSKALIFPSTSESFGLPLLEAKDLKLDIIASELDFVRDVCDPIQTFDPYSPVSIARAVKRHMGICEDKTLVSDAKIFWQKLLWLYKENSIS
jgi:glycosyltransferase involved in cell wall biosynthesis